MNNSESKLVQDLRGKKQSQPKETNKLMAELAEKKSDNSTEDLLSNYTNLSSSELTKQLDSETPETKQFFEEYINSLVANSQK